jgi:L-malate glycosyltransferase
MKVLIIPSWYVSKSRPDSGIYFKQQATAFNDAGHDAGIVFVNNHMSHWKEKVKEKQYYSKRIHINEGVKTVRLDAIGLPLRWHFTQKKYALRVLECYECYVKQFGQPDIIHAHGYMAAYAASFITDKTGINFVYSEHTSFFKGLCFPSSHLPMIRIASEKACAITAVSSALRDWMEQIIPKQIIIVPNMVNTKLFNFEQDFNKKCFTYLFVGDLIGLKNPKMLLSAFLILKKNLPDFEGNLFIVGMGKQKSELENWIKEQDLSRDIHFYGLLSSEKVAKKMKAANCLVLCSEIETFGVVLIEAMASGLPIISTNCGGPADIITPDVGILVNRNNILELSEAMREMYLQNHQWDSHHIRKQAILKYSNEAVTKKWIELFSSLLFQKN